MKTQKKILRTSKVLTVFIVLSVIAAMAAGTQVLYESSGTSSFKLFENEQGSRGITQKFQNYDIYRKYTQQGGEELFLVNSAKTIQYMLDAEGIFGNISWSVRKGPRLETRLWGKTEDVTELNVNGSQPVLVTGKGGCCAEMTGYRLYNIETGRLLMSFNDYGFHDKVVQPFSLEIPNSTLPFRYIGVLSQDSTRDRDFATPEAGKAAALLVKYAREYQKQQIQLDMELASGFAVSVLEVKIERDPTVTDSDKIEIQDDQVRLWNIDGSTSPSDISGVLLKIVMDGGFGPKTIKIPVRSDGFDLKSAEIPPGVSARFLPK